jgi:hypothetical protein
LKNLLRNREGTAEVIGTIMFVIILLFFFTNVYLWHDAAVKQMDNMYVQKINTPIVVALASGGTQLNVTDRGGEDATLTMLWIDSGSGPSQTHTNVPLNDPVPAGSSFSLNLPSAPTQKTVFTVVTTLGNMASCTYTP